MGCNDRIVVFSSLFIAMAGERIFFPNRVFWHCRVQAWHVLHLHIFHIMLQASDATVVSCQGAV